MPVGERDFSLLQNDRNDSGSPSNSYSKYNGVLSRGLGGQGVRLTTQLHMVLRLIVTESVTVLPLLVFMSWTGRDFPLYRLTLERILCAM